MAPPSVARSLLFGGLLLGVLFAASVLVDRAVGALGLAGAGPGRATHPPGMSVRRESLEFTYDFRTNSQGLRSPEIPLAKPAGIRRLLVIGDSFVEGEGVTDDARFTSHLERALSTAGRIEVINGGLSGTAPLEYGRMFLSVGLKYDPDALLICLFANDVFGTPAEATPRELVGVRPPPAGVRGAVYGLWPAAYTMVRELRDGWERRRSDAAWNADIMGAITQAALARGLTGEQIATWRSSLPRDVVEATQARRFNGTILWHGLVNPTYWTDSLDLGTARAEEKWRAMIALVTEIVQQARRRGIRPAVVFLPDDHQYDPARHRAGGRSVWREVGVTVREAWLHDDTEVQRRLVDWSRAHRVPFLDLTPALRRSLNDGAALTYRLDGHWTPAGHRVAADVIEDWIRRERVFDGSN
jgi:hypothetical protein